MKKLFVFILMGLFLGLGITSIYAANLSASDLIDQVKNATEVQRVDLANQNIGTKIKASGTVSEVRPYNAFNETKDTGSMYYQVITEVQNTANSNPYQVSFFFKDKTEAEKINKGQAIDLEGTIIKIFDTRLWMALWIFEGDFTAADKDMFAGEGSLPDIQKID